MKSRLRELRKNLGITQLQLAKSLGISDSAISRVEKGENALTESNIKLICTAFNVNENWLRTGEGEMFVHTVPNTIDQLAKEFSLDDLDKKILSVYAQLPAQHRAALKEYLFRLVKELAIEEEQQPATPLHLVSRSGAETETELTKEKADAAQKEMQHLLEDDDQPDL